MASYRPKVVNVQLSNGLTAIQTATFNIPLIITRTTAFTDRLRVYTSASDLLTDGFLETSPAYVAAVKMFNGDFPPPQIVVGRRAVTNFVASFGSPVTGNIFSVTLKSGSTSKTFSTTADATPTATEIATALQTAIEADVVYGPLVVATVVGSTLQIVPSGAFDIGVNSNVTLTTTAAETVTDAFAAIQAEDNSWFWMMQDSHTTTDVLALAALAPSNKKMYAWSSQEAGILTGDANSVLAQVAALSYDPVWFVKYAADADTTFPEAAGIGAYANITPGTSTMHGKTLVGVPYDTLSATQYTNISKYNGNYYLKEKGVGFYRDGFTASGMHVDDVHYSYYFATRVDESLFGLIKRQSDLGKKVTIDDEGKQLITQALYNNPINIDVRNGAIFGNSNGIEVNSDGTQSDYRPVIYIPSRGDLSANDLANRVWSGLSVTVTYRTPAHYITINASIV